jgi:hypothetical protein
MEKRDPESVEQDPSQLEIVQLRGKDSQVQVDMMSMSKRLAVPERNAAGFPDACRNSGGHLTGACGCRLMVSLHQAS